MNKRMPVMRYLQARCFLLFFLHGISQVANAQHQRECTYANNLVSQEAKRNDSNDTGEVLYIPIVVHVVYSADMSPLPVPVIEQQIKTLNEDFNRRNSDSINTMDSFKSIAAKSKIVFFVASTVDKSAIIYKATNQRVFSNNDLHFSARGGSDAWDTKRFLNIWVASLAPGILGYGTPPGTDADVDGVAVHYQHFGTGNHVVSPFDRGRTLTHEVGHWLGLSHIWGEGGCESDDGLADTPRQDEPVTGCNLTYMSCGNLCMIQNFMGAADDNCMNIFTKQQIDLMRMTLLTFRNQVPTLPSVITDIAEKPAPEFQVYPNPVSVRQPLYVRLNNLSITGLRLVDIRGSFVKANFEYLASGEAQLCLSEILPGMYFLISTGHELLSTKIIIKP